MVAERGGGGGYLVQDWQVFLAFDQILRVKCMHVTMLHSQVKFKNCLSHDHYKCQTLKSLMENIEGKGKIWYTVVLQQEFANIK